MKLFYRTLIIVFLWNTSDTLAGSKAAINANLDPQEVVKFAKDVEKYAASKGARAFIVSRLGTPKSELPDGVHFTHIGVAIYSTIQLEDGKTVNGYAIHNLYQDAEGSNSSSIVTDYPVDFFWGAMELKAGVIIPTPELQQLLIENISSGKHLSLHNPKYSVLSNPFNSKYQNCTEYVLDVINSSIYQTTDKKQLKANAKAHFKPKRIKKSLKLFFGRLLKDDVTTKDHGRRLYTATFTTIGEYLESNQLATDFLVLKPNGITEIM